MFLKVSPRPLPHEPHPFDMMERREAFSCYSGCRNLPSSHLPIPRRCVVATFVLSEDTCRFEYAGANRPPTGPLGTSGTILGAREGAPGPPCGAPGGPRVSQILPKVGPRQSFAGGVGGGAASGQWGRSGVTRFCSFFLTACAETLAGAPRQGGNWEN